MLSELRYYARMALGQYRFIRAPRVSDPEQLIKESLRNREANFLTLAREVVFASSNHPYHAMFRLAGCTYDDLEQMVNRDGLESALEVLYRQGVYLTHDEFKGKVPIRRGSHDIPAVTTDFRNPLADGLVESVSSGSRSEGVRTVKSVGYQVYLEAWTDLISRELLTPGGVSINLGPTLPSTWGVGHSIAQARRSVPSERWFPAGGSLSDTAHYRFATSLVVLEARLMGLRVPFPTYLPPNDYGPVAEYIARRRREGVPAVVVGMVSSAVRTAAAAREHGLDIGGTRFLVGGEALTDAKLEVFRRAGAEAHPNYYICELGLIGYACGQMKTGNCVHVASGLVAVTQRKRVAPLSDVEVNSLLFTSLQPFAPFVLINAEMDDAGEIGEATCDCLLSKVGMRTTIGGIYSYGKLTGQGVTLMGSDLLRVLEVSLPERFGGAPGDFQLVEEDAGNQTELSLRVSPRLGLSSTDAVQEYFLAEVKKLYGGSLASLEWRHSKGVKTVLADPITGSTGKILPLHLLASRGQNGQ